MCDGEEGPRRAKRYNAFLPYKEEFGKEAVENFDLIKQRIAECLQKAEIRPGLVTWLYHLHRFLNLQGYTFSKEDHVELIYLLLDLIVLPDLNMGTVYTVAATVCVLLNSFEDIPDLKSLDQMSVFRKKELLKPEDLTIEWRPLYELTERFSKGGPELHGLVHRSQVYEIQVQNMVRACRAYFPFSATEEMLDEWLIEFSPIEREKDLTLRKLKLFLPTTLPPEHSDKGWKLWIDRVLSMWMLNRRGRTHYNLTALLARLAEDNIGYIDWEQWIPKLFTRLLRSFNLPYGSGEIRTQRESSNRHCESTQLTRWIVACMGGDSAAMSHLRQLFKTVESFYHPSNNGKWTVKLNRFLSRLTECFQDRLYFERFKKFSWKTAIPEAKKLTENDIDEFVDIVRPIAQISIFSKGNCTFGNRAIQVIAGLRPQTVIPFVLEQVNDALYSVLEPHRLVSSLTSLEYVSRPLMMNHTKLGVPVNIPLLLRDCLPGIDPNDPRKTAITFRIIYTLIQMIPLHDCSHMASQAPADQEHIYSATAGFEELVFEFLARVFVVVENTGADMSHQREPLLAQNSLEDELVNYEMRMALGVMLRNSPPRLYRVAIDSIFRYVNGRIFEPHSGKLMSTLVRYAASENPEYTLGKFMNHFCEKTLDLLEQDEVLKEEQVDNELLFSLNLLSDLVFGSDAEALYPYIPILIKTVQRSLQMTSRTGYLPACQLLQQIFRSLVFLAYRPSGEAVRSEEAPFQPPPVTEWGKSTPISEIKIDWHVASEKDIEFSKEVYVNCAKPVIDTLEKWTQDPKANTLTKSEVWRALSVLWSTVQGLGSCLPELSGKPVDVGGLTVPSRYNELRFPNGFGHRSYGENLRDQYLDLLSKVVDTILLEYEDDVRSLNLLSRIISLLCFYFGVTKKEYDHSVKTNQHYSALLIHPLCNEDERHLRHIIVDRVLIQHKLRLHQLRPKFSESHVRAIKILFRLCMSHYTQVRCTAQESLNRFFVSFPRSYNVILDEMCAKLTSSDTTHDQFKGILFTILGTCEYKVVPSNNWPAMRVLWPALLKARYSEKPSIIALLKRIQEQILTFMESYPIKTAIPTSIINRALRFYRPDSEQLPDSVIVNGEDNMQSYKALVSELTSLITTGNLHWRQHYLGLTMVKMLLRDDVNFEEETVRMIVNHLISEHVRTRKICMDILSGVLYQQKRAMVKIKLGREQLKQINDSIPLNPVFEKCLEGGKTRPCNLLLQYNTHNFPNTQEKWDRAVFVHKPHFGYSGFKDTLEVYAPDHQQPPLPGPGNMNPTEEVIYQAFTDPDFVQKLVFYLAIEELKGKDKFDGIRVSMFKLLFRNYGPVFVDIFLPYVEKYIRLSKQESEQRCGLEIMCGMIRGAKHWNFTQTHELAERVAPLFDYSNLIPETIADWGQCVATILESRDCNKYYWLFEIISRDVFSGSSFIVSSKLWCLLGGIVQIGWRMMEINHRLLEQVKPHLAHPYLNVRERIAQLLVSIFSYGDRMYEDDQTTMCDIPDNLILPPNSEEFLKEAMLNLSALKTENHEQEKEVAKRLFQTLCKWQVSYYPKYSRIFPKEALLLLPTACRLFADTSNDELKKDCCLLLTSLGYEMLSVPTLRSIINDVRLYLEEPSWRVRDYLVSLFRFATFSNIFAILSNEDLLQDVRTVALSVIADESVEVRSTGQAALSGLIHCGLVEVTDEHINTAQARVAKIARTLRQQRQRARENAPDKTVTESSKDEPAKQQRLIIEYHAGILLLCAYISAYPYDVHDFMPRVICLLADHSSAPQPISTTITNCLSEFKRTHHDNWRDHKEKFTGEQLTTLTDLLVSPSYYA